MENIGRSGLLRQAIHLCPANIVHKLLYCIKQGVNNISPFLSIEHVYAVSLSLHNPTTNDLLVICAKYGDVNSVRYLIEKKGAKPWYNRHQALMSAARNGNLKTVKYLKKYNTSTYWTINNKTVLCTYLLLQESIKGGHLILSKYIVENYNISSYINDALCLCAEEGHIEIMKYLVSKGAWKNTHEYYPLRISAMKGYLDIVKYLTESKKVLHSMGTRILSICLTHNHHDIIEYLSSKGVKN